jgi:negative regulator of sigma E activity
MSEKVSALMDGAPLPGGNTDLFAEIGADPESAALWERYHLIRYFLRGQSHGVPDSILRGDLAARIRERIEDEPTCLAPAPLSDKRPQSPRPSRRRWLEAAGGLAVAASIITAVTIGLSSRPEPGPGPGAAATAGITHWETAQPEFESDLTTYLVQHGEFSSPSGLNGLIAYAKIVSYNTDH